MKFTIDIPDDIETVVPLSELEPEVEYREALLGDYFLSTSGSVVQSIGKGAGVERIVFTRKPKPEPPKWLGAVDDNQIGDLVFVTNIHCGDVLQGVSQRGYPRNAIEPKAAILRPDIMPPSPELAALFETGGEA